MAISSWRMRRLRSFSGTRARGSRDVPSKFWCRICLRGGLSRKFKSRRLLKHMAAEKDGTELILDVNLHRFATATGEWAVAVVEDITARKRVDAALRESEERFRNMADSSPLMICCSNPDRNATFFNKSWLDFTGRSMEQELGHGWVEAMHPDDRERALKTYQSSCDARQHCYLEYRLRRYSGEYRWILCSGVPRFAPDGVFAGYIASCADITDEKHAKEDALVLQRLESMRRLANGVAHDFNNLFGSILTSTEIATAAHADGAIAEELERIRRATIRGSEIVHQLEIYGQIETGQFEPLNIARLIEQMLDLLNLSISKSAILQLELDCDLPEVCGNPASLRQVVMSLVMNASEAIGDRAGSIRLTNQLVKVGPETSIPVAFGLRDGDYLCLEVSDTGCGMSPEVQSRIFDPFFTTKFPGRGHGLGLAATRSIIRNHDGAIVLASTPERGTTFQILLPVAQRESQLTPPATVAPVEQTAHRGTVLVVEDDDLLRLAASKALAKRGFFVLEAADGTAAIEQISSYPAQIDAILLDLTLSGISSRVVLEEARRMRPNIKIIMTSAHPKEKVREILPGLRVEHFIRKPYHIADLATLIRSTESSY